MSIAHTRLSSRWCCLSKTIDLIGPADAVKPFDVYAQTEETARAYFIRLRFAKWGGMPACEDCNCTAVYTYKSRHIFKCKMCLRQFSPTSNTPWAYRKLSFRKLMTIVAAFSINAQAVSTRELCRNIGVQYKTVFVWLHKIRNELAERAKGFILSGEIEIDGSEYGGFIRPKNVKKKRDDHRKMPFRSNSRALTVVAARERGGSVRTWVAKHESDARSFIRDAISPDAVLFADQGVWWSWLRARHQLFTINHKEAYYSPEACTNQAENYFRALRIMERIQRHISGQYLDLYAADAAWRIERNKWTDKGGWSDAVSAMSRCGRSELAGYFQGRKRSLSLCQRDGTTKAWRPPSRSERLEKRVVADGGGLDEIGSARKPPGRRTWFDGFDYFEAQQIAADPSCIPNGAGVYTLWLSDGAELLNLVGFKESSSLPLWRTEHGVQVYVGETYDLRSRVLDHLLSNADRSTPRRTIMALQHSFGTLPDLLVGADRALTEASLTAWLSQRAVVGVKRCGYVKAEETSILLHAASPLNLVRPNPCQFGKFLSALRAEFNTEIGNGWPKAEAGWRPSRR